MKKQKKNMVAVEAKRQPCEVFSRIVGYLRPVQQWNDGKAAEFDLRKEYKINNFQ